MLRSTHFPGAPSLNAHSCPNWWKTRARRLSIVLLSWMWFIRLLQWLKVCTWVFRVPPEIRPIIPAMPPEFMFAQVATVLQRTAKMHLTTGYRHIYCPQPICSKRWPQYLKQLPTVCTVAIVICTCVNVHLLHCFQICTLSPMSCSRQTIFSICHDDLGTVDC